MNVLGNEILFPREKVNDDKNRGLHDITKLELELADVKKLLNSCEEEIGNLWQVMMKKETEQAEHEHLLTTIKKKKNRSWKRRDSSIV